MGLIEKIFKCFFFHSKSMKAVDRQGGPVCTQGALLAGFKWGSTRRCHILNIYGFRRFVSMIHVAILIPGVWPFLTPGA